MTKTCDLIKKAAENLLNLFRSGKLPDAIAYSLIHRQSGTDQPSDHWSLGNRILMLAQGTTDARGFRQWQDVNRFVKKGSRAIHILSPMVKSIPSPDNSEDCKQIITGFRPIPVFRCEDTSGQALLQADYTPPVLPPFWDVAAALGVTIEYAPVNGNYLGKFNLTNQAITLNCRDAYVYFHELAHAVHHSIVPLTGNNLAAQEIIAEMAGAVLCELQQIHGYQTNCYEYIQHYCRDKDPASVVHTIMNLLTEVELVVQKVLDVAKNIDTARAQQQTALGE